MSELEQFANLPDGFSGTVRLFPLPNLVLFPGALLPLHIFEPRYCEMLEDAMADDRVIAMALLQPGWEADYDNRPGVEPVVCVGRVVTHSPAEDGKHNILLAGLQRARIVREQPPTRSYRLADVALLDDEYSASEAEQRPALERRLINAFRGFVPSMSEAQEQFDQLLSNQVPLGALTDIVAFTLSLDVEVKQRLLAECNVDLRAAFLLQLIQGLSGSPSATAPGQQQSFPPDFSDN